MISEKNNAVNQKIIAKTPDDLVTLANIFSLPTLNYIDIDLQERLAQISTRWPLLTELMYSQRVEQHAAHLQQGQEDTK